VNQTRAVAALAPGALVFEMLTPEQAGRVTDANRRDMETLEAALGWEGTGWPDFAYYYPIFAAAPQAAILGANVPRSEAREAIRLGAAEAFGATAARFGLDRPLPADQQAAREAEQMEAHCNALPEEMLPGMVEAQRMRDAALADAVLKALAAGVARPVVVITGNGHARADWGMPWVLATAAPELKVLTIGQFELQAPEDPPFDLYLITEDVAREDPCAAFRKG